MISTHKFQGLMNGWVLPFSKLHLCVQEGGSFPYTHMQHAVFAGRRVFLVRITTTFYVSRSGKVKATIPLTRRTLVPKGLQSRRGQFTNFCNHARSNHSATALVARVQDDQSHGSAWGTSVTHHMLYIRYIYSYNKSFPELGNLCGLIVNGKINFSGEKKSKCL